MSAEQHQGARWSPPTEAELDRFEDTALPLYLSTREAGKASKFLVSDLSQWVCRLVDEVRRLRDLELFEAGDDDDR